MKKCIFLPFILIFSSACLWGQVFIGPKMGMTLSNYGLTTSDKDNYNSNLNFGLLGGATLEIPFSSTFSMQAEVYFSQKGTILNRNDNADTTLFPYKCIHEKLNYIELPLLFRYRFQGRPMGGFITAGSAIGRALGGKRILGSKESALEKDKTNIEIGTGSTHDYKPFDIGLVIGGGLSYEIEVGELIFDARYVIGATRKGNIGNDVKNPYHQGNSTNRSLQLSLGIIFPIGG